MAKIKHPNPIDSLYDLISNAADKGVAHLKLDNEILNGREISINGNKLINFTSYSYMGLELHPKVKEGALNAALNQGCMFPSSRAYLSSGKYEELESLLTQIFNANVIVTQSTTLGHLSLIPALVTARDMIILDHQVHHTVQTPAKIAKLNGTRVEILKHNDINKLDKLISENHDKYERIWYMADSIYSMFGDLFPAKEVIPLLDKYEDFYVYLDDAHGMSWVGENGKGWGLHNTRNHKKIIIALSLSKGFGASGGALIFSDPNECHRVKTVGGNIIFTGPLTPPNLGASIASAKIHLTNEITQRQNNLKEKIRYFNELLLQTDLPLISNTQCPIFFIGTGLPRLGQNVVKRMLNRGFFVNIAMFPAVPINCTGIRISLNTHLQKTDLENLVTCLSEEFPKAMEDENRSFEQIYSAFRTTITDSFPQIEEKQKKKITKNDELKLLKYNTIQDIDKDLWNKKMPNDGCFDWNGMLFLEQCFSDNETKEHNWNFYYFEIKDKNNEIILLSFFTDCLVKDDMLSPPSVSQAVEERRTQNPYLYTSKSLLMGSSVTTGSHLYLDKNKNWQLALEMLFDQLTLEKEWLNASQLILRDFEANDNQMKDFMFSQAYFHLNLPDANILNIKNITDVDNYIEQLSSRNRKHIRKDVLPYEKFYEVELYNNNNDDDDEKIKKLFDLYINVKNVNYDFNIFPIPFKFIKMAAQHRQWEIIVLNIAEDHKNKKPIAMGLCYKTKTTYIPLYAGLDYKYLKSHQNYRQLTYQAVKRAIELKKESVIFGYSASIEKRKFGAETIEQVAYFQTVDTYKFDKLANMQVRDVKEHYKKE